jgi:predicted ester cyclase
MRMPVFALLAIIGEISIAAEPQAPEPPEWFTGCMQYANGNRLEEYADCWAPDAINNGRPVKKEFIRIIMEDIRRTFPDYHSEVIQRVVQGETIVTMSRVSGTHRGVAQTNANGGLLLGAKPTGKRFEVLQTHWWKIQNGKIVSHQGVRDDLGMVRQLGLVPDELDASLKVK